MDIWILVIALIIVAIVLLIASFFVDDGDDDLDEKINEYSSQQSQELYAIKTRVAELEKDQREVEENNSSVSPTLEDGDYFDGQGQAEDYPVAEELEDVTDETREQIIRLYSQGYTMHEISQEVRVNTSTVQFVIDDYIENR